MAVGVVQGITALRQAGNLASKFEALPIVSKILKFDPVEGPKMIDYSANKILKHTKPTSQKTAQDNQIRLQDEALQTAFTVKKWDDPTKGDIVGAAAKDLGKSKGFVRAVVNRNKDLFSETDLKNIKTNQTIMHKGGGQKNIVPLRDDVRQMILRNFSEPVEGVKLPDEFMAWKDKNNPLNYLLRGTMYLNKIKEDKLIPKNVKKNFFDVQNLSDTIYSRKWNQQQVFKDLNKNPIYKELKNKKDYESMNAVLDAFRKSYIKLLSPSMKSKGNFMEKEARLIKDFNKTNNTNIKTFQEIEKVRTAAQRYGKGKSEVEGFKKVLREFGYGKKEFRLMELELNRIRDLLGKDKWKPFIERVEKRQPGLFLSGLKKKYPTAVEKYGVRGEVTQKYTKGINYLKHEIAKILGFDPITMPPKSLDNLEKMISNMGAHATHHRIAGKGGANPASWDINLGLTNLYAEKSKVLQRMTKAIESGDPVAWYKKMKSSRGRDFRWDFEIDKAALMKMRHKLETGDQTFGRNLNWQALERWMKRVGFEKAKNEKNTNMMDYFKNLEPLETEFGTFKEGGLINEHLTDTIPPKRGPMPQGLPLLDPLESIDRSQRQNFAVGGFANLFGKLGRVPKAVGRFGDLKKPSLAKPQATTEVVVGQAVEDKPAMFLSTVNAIEEMPDAANMNAQQWLGTIRNKPGVSATELDEFGLEAMLTNMHKANPKQKLTKAQLIENYNREMPKIDMDIAIAEPVSRGGKDLAKMLLQVREKRGQRYHEEGADIFSNDARLLTDLHQPPQDRVGFVLRGKLIDIMKGTTHTEGVGDDVQDFFLLRPQGKQSFQFDTGSKFKNMWEKAFPNLFHTTNNIVKQGYRDELSTLVPSQDVTKLSIAKNIPEEQAFEELYQALNIFDRQVMTADVPIPFWTKKLLYRLGDMSEGRGFFYKSKRTPAHEGAQFIPGGSGYGELKFYQNFDTGAVRAKEGTYKSGHFSGEVFQGNTGNSPFGWLRFSERIDENGRKILMAEEIQSDLHQAVAQKGYNYAPRLDKHDVLAEMGEFAKQLDTKKQTLESTRLRKDAIKQLPRVERESPANVAELKNIEKAIKKLIGDVKKLQKKVEDQAKATGRSGQVHPDTAFKKSENYAKLFMQGLMKMANDKGYDGIALSSGKMKKAHGSIPKGGDKFYDEIGVKAMKRMAKKSGFKFTDTTIVDGNGFTWEKIPLIEMRDINTGIRIPGEATIPVYKKGGIVNKKMVKK